jgi:hypothetical protein
MGVKRRHQLLASLQLIISVLFVANFNCNQLLYHHLNSTSPLLHIAEERLVAIGKNSRLLMIPLEGLASLSEGGGGGGAGGASSADPRITPGSVGTSNRGGASGQNAVGTMTMAMARDGAGTGAVDLPVGGFHLQQVGRY